MISDKDRVDPLDAGADPAASTTRTRLIAAAREIIREVGLKRARMEDIATKAGVSRAALYYHFNTKGDLAAAIIDDVCERLTVTVRTALADGPIHDVIAATVRFFADQVAVARLMITDMALPADPIQLIARHHDVLQSALRQRIAADIAAGRVRAMDPDVAAQAVVALMRVAPIQLICNESADLDHLTAELTDFLTHAFAPPP
jgi:AcrR family transcriptional regulator